MGSTINPNQTLLQGKNLSASNTTPAPLAANSSRVSFEFQNVQPPSILYVDDDDRMVISAASSLASEIVTVNVRLLLPDGRLEDMQFILQTPNTRFSGQQIQSLAQGYIVSVSAVTALATTRGQTFVRVALSRSASGGAQPAQVLFADYVTTKATSAYPNGRVLGPTEGTGNVYAFQVTNPAAGADWSQLLPANTRWRLRCWNGIFTASATVANRQIQAILSNSSGLFWKGGPFANVTAGVGANVSAGGITPYTEALATDFLLPLPTDIVLVNNPVQQMNVAVQTAGIQAGDQWAQIFLLVEEWLDNV